MLKWEDIYLKELEERIKGNQRAKFFKGNQRAKVFGGWLVVNYFGHTSQDGYWHQDQSMVFIPDPNHEWKIDNANNG